MFKKIAVERKEGKGEKKGFRVVKSDIYKHRMEREERIKAARNKTGNPTNKEIYALLLDIAERQSEIFDMIKEGKG